VAAGQARAALADAERAGPDSSPEARVILAHARMAAGDGDNARRTLEPLLAAPHRVPERVRLQACLVEAQLGYHSGDWARGRRSLGRALRLAERAQAGFALDRSWIEPVLDETLNWHTRHLLPPPPSARLRLIRPRDQAAAPAVEPLTEREEVAASALTGRSPPSYIFHQHRQIASNPVANCRRPTAADDPGPAGFLI
jgi:LuxR family maltose regulon positive regulatory protein